jgi:hypothetical protein
MNYSQIIGIGKAFMLSGIITSSAALIARIYFL